MQPYVDAERPPTVPLHRLTQWAPGPRAYFHEEPVTGGRGARGARDGTPGLARRLTPASHVRCLGRTRMPRNLAAGIRTGGMALRSHGGRSMVRAGLGRARMPR
eukprot:10563000-Lingulodinium_polyedra.AAC.1